METNNTSKEEIMNIMMKRMKDKIKENDQQNRRMVQNVQNKQTIRRYIRLMNSSIERT